MVQSYPTVDILLFGVGSIGAVYLYQLQQAGCKVTAVCRSNYEIVRKHGLKLNSKRYGNVTYQPDSVVRDVSECAHDYYDFVVVCSKAFSGKSQLSLAQTLRPVLNGRSKTAIVLAQNGIHIEEDIATAYPENAILSGVVYCPAQQTSPGVIEYNEMLNLLELGTYPADAPAHHKAAANEFAHLMRKGGGGAEVHDDVQICRWAKLIMNAVWNPICALTLCTDGQFLTTSSPFAHDLVWGMMVEIVQLAKKLGMPGIDEEAARVKIQLAQKRADTGTGREMSMLQDLRQSRPLEVEAIIGNAVHLAQEQGLQLIRLETVYALISARASVLNTAT